MSMVKALNRNILAGTLFLFLLTNISSASAQLKADKGSINISGIDLQNSAPLELNGEWEFYWNKLLTIEDFRNNNNNNIVPDYLQVPLVWNDQQTVARTKLTGNGYATYRLQIIKDENQDVLSLYIPNIYTSYALYVNEELIAENGQVGTIKAESYAQWKPQIKVFETTEPKIDLILHVSNFYHNRGGIHKPLKLGSYESVIHQNATIVISNILLFGGLLILGAFFIGFFFIRQGQRATLFFGLLCLLWGIRSLFSNSYLITSIFPDVSWNFAIRIEYISLYLSMLFGMLFITHVFIPNRRPLIKYIILTINYCFIALTILLPPLYFTKLLPAYQLFIALNFVFAIIVTGLAIHHRQKEAWFSATAILLGVMLFTYELTTYNFVESVNYIYLNLGYLVVFFLNSLVLASHFVSAYRQIHVLEKEKTSSFERRLRST